MDLVAWINFFLSRSPIWILFSMLSTKHNCGHTVPTAAAAQSNDIGIFSSESINTQETTTSKRKRTWNMSSKALEDDSLDDFEGEDDRG